MRRAAIILTLLTACSGSGWASAQEDAWRDSCINSPMACECMLDWFKDHDYSFDDVSGPDGFDIGFRASVACGP